MHVLHALERLNRSFGVLSGLAIFVITLIIVTDVTLRSAFNMPVPGATELSTLLLVALIYLGLASVQTAKQNYRVEILIGTLSGRPRAVLDFITTALSALAIGILAWFTTLEGIRATSVLEMSFGAITFPVWPARLMVAFGLILLTIQLLIDTLRIALGVPSPYAITDSGSLTE